MKDASSDRVLDTVELALEGISPLESGRALFLRAVPLRAGAARLRPTLLCEQTWKPSYDALVASGYRVNEPIEGRFDLILFLPTQQRDENYFTFARALELLTDSGTLLCVMPNELGAKRFEDALRKRMKTVESLSKHHCRAFWYTASGPLTVPLDDWKQLGAWSRVEGTDLRSRPGIFGWSKIDRGSELLARSLPALHALPLGRGADLGAGYGYLAARLLERGDVTSLLVVEAERLGVEACEMNLASAVKEGRAVIHWHDVSRGLAPLLGGAPLDWVVMNPPFHEQKETSLELGGRFIEVVAQSLRTGGELFMVANEHLPYLPVLRERFSECRELTRERGFKVLWARK